MKYVYLAQVSKGNFEGSMDNGLNIVASVEQLETPIEKKTQKFELVISVGSNSHDEMKHNRMGNARICRVPLTLSDNKEDKILKRIKKEVELLFKPEKSFESIPAEREKIESIPAEREKIDNSEDEEKIDNSEDEEKIDNSEDEEKIDNAKTK